MFQIILLLLGILTLVGSLLETFVPGVITKPFQTRMSALTIGFLGIIFSIVFLMVFLKARNREGFEDRSVQTQWNTLVIDNKIPEICKIYTELYEKTMTVEKGAPPEPVKTDAQAREAVDKIFAEVMTTPPLSCSLFEEVNSQKDNLDSFFKVIQKVPDIFLIQVLETANACRTLLIRQYNKLQQAEQERKEGFEDFTLCTDKAAEERKAFKERKSLSEEAQKCLLVEEIPLEQKEQVIQKKLTALQDSFTAYKGRSTIKDSIQKILDDCAYYKEQLDVKKKEAEDLSNKYNF